MADNADPLRWVRRAAIGLALVVGWLFVLWQNRFHITAPVVFVCLGYLAVVMVVVNLWRTGAIAVARGEARDEAWERPIGERGELEKQKKTLLKAIKEAEFDRDMGKLSSADADEMIKVYRGRAIAVIKEIDRLEAGEGASVREQIEREVKARLELDPKKAKHEKEAT